MVIVLCGSMQCGARVVQEHVVWCSCYARACSVMLVLSGNIFCTDVFCERKRHFPWHRTESRLDRMRED